MNINNSVGSALASGFAGVQRASDDIASASASIVQQTARSGEPTSAQNTSLTSDVVSLSVGSINAQASAKVIETADDMIGRFINETV